MIVAAPSPRALAVLLVLLMMGPTLPVAEATHVTSSAPGLPGLPHAEPSATCIGLGVPPEVLARLASEVNRPSVGYREKEGVPSLCRLDGRPMDEWVSTVRSLDAVLESFRNISAELDRQYRGRLEYSLPEGPCTPGDQLGGAQPLACPVLRPQITLLSDRFDGRRLGGFGEWTVVTDGNEEPALYTSSTSTNNGTQHTWRFGGDEGYLRGAHQYLVSPQMDMGAVRGDPSLVQNFVRLQGQARTLVRSLCPGSPQIPVGQIVCPLSPDTFTALANAYEGAIDDYTRGLVIGQHAARVDITFRMNMPYGEDGVRLWAWTGEEPPTRVQLFDLQNFGRNHGTVERCTSGGKERLPVGQIEDDNGFPTCQTQFGPEGGAALLPLPARFSKETAAFADENRAPRPTASNALTGDERDFVTFTVNLSQFVGQRVWLVFEIMTTPDLGRGEDYFGDLSRFPRQESYGFELARVHATGDAWPRNVRLNDLSSAFPRIPPGNPYGDARSTRTDVPPGRDVVARVHNAGSFQENATLRVTWTRHLYDGTVPVGGFETLAEPTEVRVVNLRPGETREVRVPWPADLAEHNLYIARGTLTVDDLRQLPPLTNATSYADPSVTPVRPRNQAESENAVTASLTLRAYTDHRLSPAHYPPTEQGPALEVCSTVSLLTGCKALDVAPKGERRTLLMGVRNDGSLPEDASAVLHLTLDGVDKTSIISDGPVRPLQNLLPGEVRPVTWQIAPGDGGVYEATVILRLANGSAYGEPIKRLVFVQRSTGVVCFDDLAANRECGPAFAAVRPDELRNKDVTAFALSPDGVAYVTTAITRTSGGLWRENGDGTWTRIETLSGESLDERLGRIRGDIEYGSIREIVFAPDGTLYLAGDNATLLARSPLGQLVAVGFQEAEPGPLVALPGAKAYDIEAGTRAWLVGSATGGTPGYSLFWRVKSQPEGGDATFPDGLGALAAHTNFTATVLGPYELVLNATDAAGATVETTVVVNVVDATPRCTRQADGSVLPGTLLSRDAVDADAVGAADVVCTSMRHDANAFHLALQVRKLDQVGGGTTRYRVDYNTTNGGYRWAEMSWNGAAFTLVGSSTDFAVTATQDNDTVRLRLPRSATERTSADPVQGLKVSACASPCSQRDDAFDGVSRRYDPATDVTPPARVPIVTAAPAPRDRDVVVLQWPASAGATRYNVSRAVGTDADWTVVGETTSTEFRDQKLEPGIPVHYRVTAVDAADNRAPPSPSALGSARLPRPDHRALAHWNGTLFVGGVLGDVWWYNETAGRLDAFRFTLKGNVTVDAGITDFAVSSDGKRLYASTRIGAIFVNEGHGAAWRTTWNETSVPTPRTYAITGLAAQGDAIYAVGTNPTTGGVILKSTNSHAFAAIPGPQFIGRVPKILGVAAAPEGGLFLRLDNETVPLATCSACDAGGDVWTFPAAPLPSVVRDGVTRRADVLAFASSGERFLALLQGGTILDYARRGAYENEGDWSVVPALTVRDGQAFQATFKDTQVRPDSVLQFTPVDTSNLHLGWNELRVTYNHHIAFVGNQGPRMRVMYAQLRTTENPAGSLPAASTNTCPSATPQVGDCSNLTQGVLAEEFWHSAPSDAGGWTTTQRLITPPATNTGNVSTVPTFAAVEFIIPASAAVNWVIDDVRVEAYFPESRQWRTLLLWRGDADTGKTASIATTPNTWVRVEEPFGIDAISPWHLSLDLADRPVWVANNEVYPGHAGGSSPRLLQGWDSRLVSPILDLTQAFDPVISFRHLYAFKTQIIGSTDPPEIRVGDGGWVEIQYEKRGAECGSTDPTATCWSKFYHACPRQGAAFPAIVSPGASCPQGTGYPRARDLGLRNVHIIFNEGPRTDAYGHAIGPVETTAVTADSNPGRSFWGRTATPDAEGIISGVRRTEDYEEVQIVLADQRITDDKGERVNLTGRRVRVAFHLWTSPPVSGGLWDYKHSFQVDKPPTTFPGEGWYITDFKVRGARELGIDLRATNLTPRVGYAWGDLGVGPGTRVPLNVTVENRGRFDVSGYTGMLEVRRIDDAALGLTTVVEQVPLALQPLLEPGHARDHTFLWSVPVGEAKAYTLTFTVTPQGIARDEDPTDNVARLGTLSRPIPARTLPAYHAEVAVSPADATKDITRFLPVYIANTGNTVLGDNVDGTQQYFRVTRRILQMGTQESVPTTDCDEWRQQAQLTGRTGPMVDCRVWNTSVPVVFGTTVSLASVSQDVDPTTDFFWKPPTSADYRVVVTIELLERPASARPQPADAPALGLDGKAILGDAAERTARSFDTYLFDDAELGPRGLGMRGEWQFGPGWGEVEPGFRSPKAYGFGDPVLLRYTADVDTSLVSPTLDLGTARSARFALYHRYSFEDGYDGGVIEASVDGGKTWRRLRPVADVPNGLPDGYNGTVPLSAASPLHLTGIPSDRTLAFTGDSAELPQATDGWVLSIFDLTEYDEITEDNVPYDLFDSHALASYLGKGTEKDESFSKPGALQVYPSATNRTYFESSWVVGRIDSYRYWEVQNLAEDVVHPRGVTDGVLETDEGSITLPDTFWWSGSASLVDDGVRPAKNSWLTIDLRDAIRLCDPPLVTERCISGDDRVVVEWWEWMDRTSLAVEKIVAGYTAAGSPNPDQVRGVWAWDAPILQAQSYYFNLSAPSVLDRNGHWMRLQSDITDWVRPSANGPAITDISFVHTPLQTPGTVFPHHRDSRGIVVDEFTVRASKLIGGQETDARVLMTEDEAWAKAKVQQCGAEGAMTAAWVQLPCFGEDPDGINGPTPPSTTTKIAGGNAMLPRTTVPSKLGETWARTTFLPAIPAEWSVVSVKDIRGHSKDNRPVTGEVPKAWYTGPGCPAETTYNDLLLRSTANPAPPCLLPGEESRLVTPVFDLSTIAGETADLTFTHRYAFYMDGRLLKDPLASGGAVEIQVFDEQTKTWLPWKQLYPNPDAIHAKKGHPSYSPEGNVGLLGPVGSAASALDQSEPRRGGYSAYTVNDTRNSLGRVVRRDAPFEGIPVYDPSTRGYRDVQFLYSGRSIDLVPVPQRATNNGWLEERFSLDDYIGKTVRIGFHVSVSAAARSYHNTTTLPSDGRGTGDANGWLETDAKGGWWITDVAIRGTVLNGAPVQLRARAATDGNEDSGFWQLDDMGVFGSAYVDNVGIFYDTSVPYGGTEKESTLVPITIRNLGEATRPDLAIHVRELGSQNLLRIEGIEGQTWTPAVDENGQAFIRISGFSVAPGQSRTAWVNVTVKEGLPQSVLSTGLLVELRERNALTGKYDGIPFNEVQGFLKRQVPFTAQRVPILRLDAERVLTDMPAVGQPVTVSVTAVNDGFSRVALNVTCEAVLLAGGTPVKHDQDDEDSLRIAERYPCEQVSGPDRVDPRSNGTLEYSFVPTAAGVLQVRFNGTGAIDPAKPFDVQSPVTLAFHVQRPTLLYHESFDDERTVRANWTADTAVAGETANTPLWDYARGNRAPGALLIGANETTLGSDGTYQRCQGSNCKAYSRPFDLHNYTGEDVLLTFWHQVRIARHDGAQVSVVFLEDETRPTASAAWTKDADIVGHCVLFPRGGYDAAPTVKSVPGMDGQPPIAPDTLDYPGWSPTAQYISPSSTLPALFFTAFEWEESWTRATFDLGQGCIDGAGQRHDVVGRTVRFVFAVYAGTEWGPDAQVQRTRGHGWIVDDVALTLSNLTLSPLAPQRAALLDNTTKAFHLVIDNHAAVPEVIRLEVDEGNSSTPRGAVQVPSEPIVIGAREKGHIVRVNFTLPRDPSFLPTEFTARIVARSVLDPMSYETGDFQLLFMPRPWAELGVSASPPSTATQEGTETFLPITVENNGVIESVPTFVRITDTWEGGQTVTDVELPSMPSYFQGSDDALRVLDFRWRPAKGSVGLHTLVIEVDPLRVGQEYTRDNNVLVLKLPVTELVLPDVDVAAPEALRLRNAVGQTLAPLKEGGVTRFESTAGELVTLEVKLANKGRAAATNVDVRAFIGSLSLPAKNLPYIGPGEEVALTFNWVAQKGEYPLEIIARSEQVEVSTTNNRNPATGVTILVVKGFEVKVQLPDLDGILEPGTEVRVPVNVTNSGTSGEEIRLVPRVPAGWSATMAREGLFLRAGETFETTVTVVVPDDAVAGEQFISVDAIARDNPMKAVTASARTFVRAFYGGSVASTAMSAAPPELVLPIRLTNEGNSLEPWTVAVTLPAGWTAREPLPLRVSVPARGSHTVDLHVRVPEATPPGERLVAVTATLPDGTRREGLVQANVRELRSALAVVADDRPREAQGALAYPVVVENRGNVPAPFDLVLMSPPEGVQAKVSPARFELQPGAKAVATLFVTPAPGISPGAYQVEAYAAFAGLAPDTPQGRANAQRLQLMVVRPDLRAGPMEVAKAGVDVGERVVVKVPIENAGQAAVTDLPVHLFVDDVFIGEARIPALGAGETRDVSLNWTALPGAHTVTAVVDPWKDTVDPDVADNAVSTLVTVGSAPLSGLVGGSRVPMGGMLLVLLAAVAAALVATPILGARRPPR